MSSKRIVMAKSKIKRKKRGNFDFCPAEICKSKIKEKERENVTLVYQKCVRE